MTDKMIGFLGDTVLKLTELPDAYFNVNRTLYRFRMLNGSNAVCYKIAFWDGRAFQVIGTDGGLKDAPVTATSFIFLRWTRWNTFWFFTYTMGQSVYLKSSFTGTGGTTYQQGTEMNIIRRILRQYFSEGFTSTLTPITYYNPSDVVRTRTFHSYIIRQYVPMHLTNGLLDEQNWFWST